jgi:hypothetical protein
MTGKKPRRPSHWYGKLDKGADLDFLVGKDTSLVTRESHECTQHFMT